MTQPCQCSCCKQVVAKHGGDGVLVLGEGQRRWERVDRRSWSPDAGHAHTAGRAAEGA